ncbi:zinc-ribbon domain containing protein [Streptomyces sp. RKAG293]|uniref:zinc-ribbon domain containing protein n=1 Tax=Streptomyces sp. RKAG293 TaxID=2893403 RepID=UPI0020343841|nr:zinc-ribbon domain containing protein [Streptomyces sp. RKAG293]MCM2416623.1 zinc-ribbon domain-containing protein [Streptomyces sp. RKAG293]
MEHQLYGMIPYRFPNGYDLKFRPDLAQGAVRGDPSRQSRFCSHCRPPKYFYVNQGLRCRECGTAFVWPAEQQRYWYEDLRLSAAAGPPGRCPKCGRARRAALAVRQRLSSAADTVRTAPEDIGALLEYAAAMAEHREKLGEGDLALAIAAARKAARLDPDAHTAHYWEGVCHDAAGRTGRAADCYRRFVHAAPKTDSPRKLLERARQRLAELQAAAGENA